MKIRNLLTVLFLNLFLILQAQQVTETVASVNSSITLDKPVEFHITNAEECIAEGVTIDITHEDAWVIFDNVTPKQVIDKYLWQIKSNGETITNKENCFVNIYKRGAAVMVHGKNFLPLTVYTGTDFGGESKTYKPGKYTSLGTTFDNNIKSLKIKRGYMVTVAQSNSGKGYSRVFMAHDNDIEISDLMDSKQCKNGNALYNKISFIRVSRLQMPTKKGVVFSGMSDALNCSWDYNYDCGEGSQSPDQEHVPMFHHVGWNSWAATGTQSDITGITHALGFNEPWNTADEGFMGDDPFAPMRYQSDAYTTGRRVGTMAPTDANFGKLFQFVDSCDRAGHRLDFVVIHYYRGGKAVNGNASAFINDVKYVYDKVKRPIWITEFNNGANWTNEWWPSTLEEQEAKQDKELTAMVKALEDAPYVERYAIYNAVERKRFVYEGKNLTPAGVSYSNINSNFAFNSNYEYIPTLPKIYPEPTYKLTTNAFTQINGAIVLEYNEPNEGYLDSMVVRKRVANNDPETISIITKYGSGKINDKIDPKSSDVVYYTIDSYYNNETTPKFSSRYKYKPNNVGDNADGIYTSTIENESFESEYNDLIASKSIKGMYQPEGWDLTFDDLSTSQYMLISESDDQRTATEGNKYLSTYLYNKGNLNLSQSSIDLPVGIYEVSFDAALNADATTIVEFAVDINGEKLVKRVPITEDWNKNLLTFTVSSKQSVKYSFAISNTKAFTKTYLDLDNIIIKKIGTIPTTSATDVTALIPNASFEGTSTKIKDSKNGGINQPENWTVAYPTYEEWDQMLVSEGNDGAGVALPLKADNGNKFVYTRLRWGNNSIGLSTDTEELPAGYYTLSFSYAAPDAAASPVVFSIDMNDSYTKEFTLASTSVKWTTKSISFNVDKAQKVNLKFFLNHPTQTEARLFLDNMKLSFRNNEVTGIEEVGMNDDLNIYVVDGYIITEDNQFAEVYDLSGRLISQKNRLQPGIYVVKCGNKTKKVLVD